MADAHSSEGHASSSISWILKLTATLIVAFAPLLLVFVVPRIIQLVGMALGWILKKKTDGRRGLLISLMDGENKKSAEKNLETKSTSSGEWQAVQEADAELEKPREFGGIVGFFHPFWCVC
jgi:alpha-1,2-mannosyltransferase